MTRHIYISFIAVLFVICCANCGGDTFKHRETEEVFHGFVTQKSIGPKTRIYLEEEEGFKAVNLADYDITPNARGRRNRVIVIPITQEQIMLSEAISEAVSKTIVDASNMGPRFIILEIDSPGGRADYMKNICTTITETKNCPVIAFISGGKFGGAYSAAAALALACDKIYMASDAVIGSLAPVVGQAATDKDVAEYIRTFSPDSLAGFGDYISALAKKNNRPGTVAMAILDRNIKVIEVTEGKDKNKKTSFIDYRDKTRLQNEVRKLTKLSRRIVVEEDSGKTREVTEMVLTLAPTDAVYCRLADRIVDSQTEILRLEAAADAQVVKSRGIDKTVRKFEAAKRNMNNILRSIDFQQARADELDAQIKAKEKWLREDTVERRRVTSDRDYWNSRERVNRARRTRRYNRSESEVVIESGQTIAVEQLMDELLYVLADLIRDYNRASALARRWPGTLPLDWTVRTLQDKRGTAQLLRDDTIRRFDVIQFQKQFIPPQRQLNRRQQRR